MGVRFASYHCAHIDCIGTGIDDRGLPQSRRPLMVSLAGLIAAIFAPSEAFRSRRFPSKSPSRRPMLLTGGCDIGNFHRPYTVKRLHDGIPDTEPSRLSGD